MKNLLTTKEQRLLLRFILLGNDSWDSQSLWKIASWLGAKPYLESTDVDNPVRPIEGYPILCAGCCAKLNHAPTTFPVILERCPSCSPKPLRAYGSAAVWKGIAKLSYIEAAISFPTIELRNIAIHEALNQ